MEPIFKLVMSSDRYMSNQKQSTRAGKQTLKTRAHWAKTNSERARANVINAR